MTQRHFETGRLAKIATTVNSPVNVGTATGLKKSLFEAILASVPEYTIRERRTRFNCHEI
jgi:hypothetical protein